MTGLALLGFGGAALANDPVGDQLVAHAAPDLTELSAAWQGDQLVIELAFDAAVNAPPVGGPGTLFGFVDLDVDHDAATGARSAIDFLTAQHPDLAAHLGVEFQVELASWAEGRMDLRDQSTGELVSRVPAATTASGVRLSLPAELVAEPGSAVHVAAVVGSRSQATDTAPNGGFVTTAPPAGSQLHGGRFSIAVRWGDFSGNSGVGTLVTQSSDSALYWFFDPDNWELLVKVLDGCGLNDRYWVFLAATTNVHFTVEVTDTLTGTVRLYSNPLGTAAAAINDIEAFATCSS